MTVQDLPRENIYGHLSRLDWLKGFLRPSDRVMEFGCGTGYMIAYPLRAEGYDVRGYDLDAESIRYGCEAFGGTGDPLLVCQDVREVSEEFDVIIASEVLEHIPDAQWPDVVGLLRDRLRPGGTLLVTVPNGYGWFEIESFLWNRLGLGKVLDGLGVTRVGFALKRRLLRYVDAHHPSTLSASPHVQRFTLDGLRKRLEDAGFEVLASQGSVLACGPLSNLLFTGIGPVMALNRMLGRAWPQAAAGFYVAARKGDARDR